MNFVDCFKFSSDYCLKCKVITVLDYQIFINGLRAMIHFFLLLFRKCLGIINNKTYLQQRSRILNDFVRMIYQIRQYVGFLYIIIVVHLVKFLTRFTMIDIIKYFGLSKNRV